MHVSCLLLCSCMCSSRFWGGTHTLTVGLQLLDTPGEMSKEVVSGTMVRFRLK